MYIYKVGVAKLTAHQVGLWFDDLGFCKISMVTEFMNQL